MKKPYIGMTDVPSADWLHRMIDLYYELGPNPRLLHAGVMMSYKTLNGLETKWAAVWPKSEEVASIFVRGPDMLNTLHYADYDDESTADDFRRVVRLGGPHLDAVQLDMVWPKPELVEVLRAAYSGLRVILQVGAKALAAVDDDAEALIERLKAYPSSIIQDVLLDMSGGQGLPMQAARLEPLIYELRARRPDLGITLAGGLGPDTLRLVEPLVRKFPELSIDAQGKLRPSGSNRDPIDAACAEAYLRKATAMFQAA